MATVAAYRSSSSVASPPTTEPRRVRLPLLSQYLREQGELTAVERFSQHHEEAEPHLQARYYRDLIPLQAPKSGQQYGFEVDLDRCSGCKSCVTACHSLNGLDEHETWRSVGLLHGGTTNEPMQKTVTTACHHCVDPACMKGCPVKAYEKDPVTGIVRHLDDQCIGCQYCVFTCPYEVPQFNPKKGIVRKCDMCADRLAEGEAPACVQACPNEAIAIRVVEVAQAIEDAQADAFLPGAPSPGITVPTTVYKTKEVMAHNMLPADFYRVHPAHQHMPLVLMLVLTQLSVGAFAATQLLPLFFAGSGWMVLAPLNGAVALALAFLALGASTAHLGRPQYAFRAILGLRTSWLSREVLAFGAFAGLASAYAAVLFHASHPIVLPELAALTAAAVRPLGIAVTAVGALGVACSVMLYHVTQRRWWNVSRTGFKFTMSAVVLGLATCLSTTFGTLAVRSSALSLEAMRFGQVMAALLALATVFKLAGEAAIFFHLRDRQQGDLKRSALLLRGELGRETIVRFGLGILGGLLLPLLGLAALGPRSAVAGAVLAALSSLALLGGEILERRAFFGAMSAPRMPGGLR